MLGRCVQTGRDVPRLILHIGGGKTGSSYLQYCFATHRDALARLGVHYPDDATLAQARDAIPTSGNGVTLGRLLASDVADARDNIHALIERALIETAPQAADRPDILISSENMQAMRGTNLACVRDAAAARDYGLLVVYYLRSVAGRAYSSHVQRVKRHLDTRGMDEIAFLWRDPASGVIRILEQTLTAEQFAIRNFDCARGDLFAHFARTALPPGCTSIPVDGRLINPSLTPSQIAYMRELNRYLSTDEQGYFAGQALMEDGGAPMPIVISEQQRRLFAGLSEVDLALLNRHLPADEQVDIIGPGERIGVPDLHPLTDADRHSIRLLAALIRRDIH